MVRLVVRVAALWAVVAVVGAQALARSLGALTADARISWGLPTILLALLAGHVVGWLAAPRPRQALGSDRHALALLVAACCLSALAFVEPHTSVKVLRERIPPFLAGLYPALTFLTPVLLHRSARSRSVADQALLGALALTSLSGALFLLEGPVALCLGALTLLLQLQPSDSRVPDDLLLRLSGAVVALFAIAGLTGLNRLQSTPSLGWIGALFALCLALAARPRKSADWIPLLAAPVVAATLMALAGALVTIYLGGQVGWGAAWRTPLTLFRQHPNFLAPYFAVHAVLAVGLALSSRALALPATGAALLLAASTIQTTSRAGIACLLAGAGLLAALLVLPRIRRRVAVLLIALVLLPPLGGALLLATPLAPAKLTVRAHEWVDKSLEFRLDAWRNSLAIVRQHPWLGVGPHTFLALERFNPGSRFFNEPSPPHPHNVPLYVAQSGGLVALVLFLLWSCLLLVRLAREAASGQRAPPRLAAATCAATAALLLADLLDLGQALDTVVPAPLYVVTGLLAAGTAPARRPRGPLPAAAWLAALLGVTLPLGVSKVAAGTAFEQGLMLSTLSDLRNGDPRLMREARAALSRAIALDPDHYSAHKLLASWVEEQDLEAARRLLERLLRRAPQYGPTHSLVGHLAMRAGRWDEAAASFMTSFDGTQGGVSRTKDAANAVVCLARAGRRADALEQLVSGLRLDAGVAEAIPWKVSAITGERSLAVAGNPPPPDIALTEAVERVFAQHVADSQAGQLLARQFWFDCSDAFRRAGRADRALQVLDYLEAHVPSAEPHIIASERGHILKDLGRLEEAGAAYRLAYERKSLPHFLTLAAEIEALREGDAPTQAPAQDVAQQAAALVFEDSGEILNQPDLFLRNLETRAAAALAAGRLLEAAHLLEKTLLYVDPLLERAARWRHAGELYLAAGAPLPAIVALTSARVEIGARPASLEALRQGYLDSIPASLARSLCQAWRALGLSPAERLARAWALPDFFSPRLAPALFRLALLAEEGRPDSLLREADLLLRIDPGNVLAMWAQMDALEALGRHSEFAGAARTILDNLGRGEGIDRFLDDLTARMPERMDDPEAWAEGAVLTFLKGRFGEAADLFSEAARRVPPGEEHRAAHLLGWEARSLLLCDKSERVALAAERLEQASGLAPECGLLRLRRETMP